MLRRRKRATAQDIYNHCKVWGNCPEDVVNKIEHTTIADNILRYGSAGVFFGGLGIGTGSGSGGRTGYTPLSAKPGVNLGSRVINVKPFGSPLDTIGIGPRDIFPVDAVRPTQPSIIPLEDLPTVIDIGPTEIEVVAEVHPVPDQPTSSVPTITTDEGTAIIEITPEPPPNRVISRTQYNNPSFEIGVETNNNVGETSASDHVYITSSGRGAVVGEEIPLVELQPRGPARGAAVEEEEETGFSTSTPEASGRPATGRGRRPGVSRGRPRITYKPRTFRQRLMSHVELPKTYTFENPAFEEDVTLTFHDDVADLRENIDRAQFEDIRELSRPFFSDTREGTLRFGRVGSRSSITTRSGITVGPQTHYYIDLSPITAGESIELSDLSVHASRLLEPAMDESAFIIDLSDPTPPYPDEHLLDVYEPVGDSSRLEFTMEEDGDTTGVPIPDFSFNESAFEPNWSGTDVSYPVGPPPDAAEIIPSPTPSPTPTPGPPWVAGYVGSDYYLHPSLVHKKKRKRFLFV